jgi:hypothetical protein
VLEFRRGVQGDEVAFYRPFGSPAELEVAVRRELLDEVLKRAGLSGLAHKYPAFARQEFAGRTLNSKLGGEIKSLPCRAERRAAA